MKKKFFRYFTLALTAFVVGTLAAVVLYAKQDVIWTTLHTTFVKPAQAQTTDSDSARISPQSIINTAIAKIKDTATAFAAPYGEPWGVKGLTMFRGNPSRTWYGTGPLPDEFAIKWKYPDTPMCAPSTVGHETHVWCGSGWTGEPVVWERPDGSTEVIFGAYDRQVHFVDARTGKDTRPPFPTGDIIKGSVTLDPDGYPLIYFGSRDNKLRVVALDRDTPTELYSLDANAVQGIWNNDWDGNPIVMHDMLFEGGENGWFFALNLNRTYGGDGKVSVKPTIAFDMPAFDAAWRAKVGDNLSIEDSVTIYKDRVYFANSGGRVLGLDISHVKDGVAPIVFDYWTGDDTDATIVAGDDGMLYVASELEKFNERSTEVGQLMKLDPYTTGDPHLWGIPILADGMDKGGIWATPAIHGDYLYVTTHTGRLLAVDKNSGKITWEEHIGPHTWSSPVVIDDELLVATCTTGGFRKYSLADPSHPKIESVYSLPSTSCIESTPAVWKGNVYVGSRDGYFYSFGAK